MEGNIIDKLSSFPSRWMIAPGRGVVWEGPKNGNSPFASLLISTLNNNDKEKLLISDLIQKLIENTKSDSKQIPIGAPLAGVGHQGGQFVFKLKITNESHDWDKLNNIETKESYDNYISKYPKGTFSSLAKKKLRKIEEREEWNLCIHNLDIKSFKDYIDKFPAGEKIREAKAFVAILEENSGVENNSNESIEKFCLSLCKKITHLEKFKFHFPKSRLIEEANSEIDKLSEYVNLKIIAECKEKFMAGRTDEIFLILLSKKMSKEFQTDLFLISNQWNTLNRNKDRRVIDFDDFTKSSNQIRMSILNMLNNIEKEI